MPRTKKYKTKKDLATANRQKVARHYAKYSTTNATGSTIHSDSIYRNRERILTQKKEARTRALLKAQTEHKKEEIEMRKRRKESHWKELQRDMKMHHDSKDPLDHIRTLYRGLDRHTNRAPSIFVENACRHYLQFKQSTAHNLAFQCPIRNAHISISNLLRGTQLFSERLLRDYGCTDYFKQAESFARRLRLIIYCIDDIEGFLLDEDADLGKAYERNELKVQNPQVKKWVDGEEDVPETLPDWLA
ncbi:hypothetical protein VNI00_006437 [Paramarasmius palmivorus]|uniref:Uncharacterized protein n=1 Tax=Paramarasmius palmivorus TaxID=297713 RepID=A0AAW0D8V4_9AGAR